MGGRGMDGLYDRPHYAIHGSLLFLALFSCTGFPEVTWMSIPQIFDFLHNVKHAQPQTTTPSHLTYDSAASSRVKTCRRRIVRRTNGRIHARIEASKQFWMAMLSHLRRCFDRGCFVNPIQFFSVKLWWISQEIRMLGRGLGLGTRDQPLWPWPWQDGWPWMMLSKDDIIFHPCFLYASLSCIQHHNITQCSALVLWALKI